jgi:acyl transferase domain-containing protein
MELPPPNAFSLFANIPFRVLSLEGKSYPWDTRASGYGRGEGVATIVIKPLEDAIRDGDPVRAVIRQTALNQDGKTQTITSPSLQAQQELIRTCYDRARLNPADTTYVEAHMTGTPTGDPVEAEAIGSVFSQGRRKGEQLYVGSVKSNIGHTEATSGLASVIKVVLALEKGLIPPNINFDKANPRINLNEWNMQVPTRLQEWPSGRLRRASINNFGYGGSNSHVILDGAFYHLQPLLCQEIDVAAQVPKIPRRSHENRRRVFALCAKDVGSLTATVVKLRDYLQEVKVEDEDAFLSNLAFTLIRRYSSFPWVAAISAGSISELVHALNVKTLELRRPTNMPQIGFVFNGQGAQWHAMGRELIDAYPIFRESAYEADQCFRDAGSSWSLIGMSS